MKLTAQDIQDEIFRKMSPSQRLKVGLYLSGLGKMLIDAKIIPFDRTIEPQIRFIQK